MVEEQVMEEGRRLGAFASGTARRVCNGGNTGWESGDESTGSGLPVLDGRLDPVLAELWDNPRDAAYDDV